MALIHWWPLNGDTKDYGLNPVVLTNNGATVDDSGKIGTCYSFDGSDDYLSVNSTDLYSIFSGGSQPFSIAMWIYNGDGSTASAADRSVIFGDYGLSGSQSFNIEKYGNNGTNNAVRFYWNGSPDTKVSGDTLLTINNWSHLVVTYDGSAVKCYINGVLVGSWTGTLSTKSKSSGVYYFGRDSRTGNTAFKGKMNDLRIYDHALTPKEVKEISKGLVLHYDFEDEEIEETTNLITGLTSLTRCTAEGNGVRVSWNTNSGDTYFFFNTSEAMVQNTTYTLSFDVTGLNESNVTFAWSNINSSPYLCTLHNGKNILTFTHTSSETRTFFDDISRNGTSNFWMGNFQLEKKDHATPFVIGTRSAGTVYDCSGNNFNTTTTTSGVQIINEAGLGRHSIYLANANYLRRDPLPSSVQTISIWLKVPTYPSENSVVFSDYGSKLAFGFYGSQNAIITGGTSARYVNNIKAMWKQDDWNNVIIIKDNDGVFHCYVNTVECSYTGGNNWTTTGYLTIGGRTNNTVSTTSNVKIADFKAYATPFTVVDIQKEYQSMAHIDKSYNLTARRFVEDPTKTDFARLDQQGVFTAKELDESAFATALNFKTYDNGDLVAREFKEN